MLFFGKISSTGLDTMIDNSQYKLTWLHFENIHPDENERRESFENLCRSIFIRKYFDKKIVLHSNHNHPGVEVEPIYSEIEQCVISFQAKYFVNKIGYTQIEESVTKTIKKYSNNINKFFLFCNKDIDTESKAYKRIKNLLNKSNINLELFTGQSILDEALNYSTVLAHYFGIFKIEKAWLSNNLNLAIKLLGTRYNNKFNINSRTEKLFSLFLRDELGINYINNIKNDIINLINDAHKNLSKQDQKYTEQFIQKLNLIEDVDTESIEDSLGWNKILEDNFPKDLEQYIQGLKEEKGSLIKDNEKQKSIKSIAEFNNRIYNLTIINVFQHKSILSTCDEQLIKSQILILCGDMGVGKTQLLACFAKHLLQQNKFVILLLGHLFRAEESIFKQIINDLLDSLPSNFKFETLLDEMEEYAYINNTFSYIFIDAINESPNRQMWQDEIIKLEHLLKDYSRIKLVISIRTGFEQECLGEENLNKIDNSIVKITHRGLDNIADVHKFLSLKNNTFSPDLYLNSEIFNPLFLTWFCQASNNNGTNTEESIIENFLTMADQEASRACKFPESYEAISDVLFGLIELRKESTKNIITRKDLLELNVWNTYKISSPISYINTLTKLGVLTSEDKDYRIGYNLLDEYIQAKYLFSFANTKEEARNIASKILDKPNWDNISIFCTFTSLYASKYKEECIELVDYLEPHVRDNVINEYFKTLAKRDSNISLQVFKELASKYTISYAQFWEPFIENSTRIGHPLNSYGLHSILINLKLQERDEQWSIFINELTEENRIINLIYYLEEKELEGINDEQFKLLLILFTWFLSSSNRILRDRTSKAMIELLKGRLFLCIDLLKLFSSVDDPYIMQRLYGVVFGAVIKQIHCDKDSYRRIVDYVFDNIFNQEKVYPDILLRDYARLIVERYEYEFPNELALTVLEKCRPPYSSEAIPSMVQNYSTRFKGGYVNGVTDILKSMEPHIPGHFYGDFGRYVFQRALEEFNDVDIENTYNYALKIIFEELGYSEQQFGIYDSNIANIRYDERWVERIGKKYQWIAFYNILARISDRHNIKIFGFTDDTIPYTGAWKPYVRDFDPTLNMRRSPKIALPEFKQAIDFSLTLANPDLDEKQANQWVNDFHAIVDNIKNLIIQDSNTNQWVRLHLFREFISRNDNDCLGQSPQKGDNVSQFSATAYLIPKKLSSSTKSKIKSGEFFKTQCISINDCYTLFNREYAWSPGYVSEFESSFETSEDSDYLLPTCINFLWEEMYDASKNSNISFLIPSGLIIRGLSLQQKEFDGLYYSGQELISYDLGIQDKNHKGELIIRKDYLDKFLNEYSYDLVWKITIDKTYYTEKDKCTYSEYMNVCSYKKRKDTYYIAKL